jgi:DNA polymerase-4
VRPDGGTVSAGRRVLLADADAFFVAVARMVDPAGAGRARLLIVGGARDGRGVVCSASYEARAFGVRSGMPMARAVKLCPRALCVPVPRAHCSAKSREIAAVLRRWAPVVEPSSIDEWYLDMGGTESLYDEPLAATARRVRDAVREATGLSVSIGGGTSKLVAKLAADVAKPRPGTAADGVHVVPAGAEEAFMAGLALADIPLVGPKLQRELERLGLRTVRDALALDDATLARTLGERTARWLAPRLRGRDDSPVAVRERAKSVSREETFRVDLHADDEIERELLRLVERAGADIREDGLRARTITVKLRDADFVTRQASRTLPEPVESDRAIASVARELLAGLRRARRVGARLVGVSLSQLGDAEGPPQLALFDAAAVPGAAPPVETERDRRLAHTVDAIRAKFGRDAITPARLLDE